jgi:hypothetical protein
MSAPQNAALLGHIASQMQLNVAFLESQNYLSAQDAATMKEIIGRLPVQTQTNITTTTQVKVVGAPTMMGGRAVPPVAPRQVPPAPFKSPTVYARAWWGYNEDGAVRARAIPNAIADHLLTGGKRSVLFRGRDDRGCFGEEWGLVAWESTWKRGTLPIESCRENGGWSTDTDTSGCDDGGQTIPSVRSGAARGGRATAERRGREFDRAAAGVWAGREEGEIRRSGRQGN